MLRRCGRAKVARRLGDGEGSGSGRGRRRPGGGKEVKNARGEGGDTGAALTQWGARSIAVVGLKTSSKKHGRPVAGMGGRRTAVTFRCVPRPHSAGTSNGPLESSTPVVEEQPWPVFVAEAQRVELSNNPLSTRPSTPCPVSSSSRATPAPSVRPKPAVSLYFHASAPPCSAATPVPAPLPPTSLPRHSVKQHSLCTNPAVYSLLTSSACSPRRPKNQWSRHPRPKCPRDSSNRQRHQVVLWTLGSGQDDGR